MGEAKIRTEKTTQRELCVVYSFIPYACAAVMMAIL